MGSGQPWIDRRSSLASVSGSAAADGAPVLSRRERRILTALCDAIAPAVDAVDPGAVALGVPAEIERWLAGFTPASRNLVRAMLVGFELTPVLSRRPQPFSRLDAVRRDRWVDSSSGSTNRARREAFSALQTIIRIAHTSHPDVAAAIGYDGRPLRPVTAPPAQVGLPLLAGADLPDSIETDVVIVGSGAGGAVVADVLSRAGLDVVVVEEGGPYLASKEAGDRPAERMLRHYRDNGLTFAVGSPTISLPMGRVVGGTTVVNSGSCFRTPDDTLVEWGRRGIPGIAPDDMAPLFDELEDVLGVQPVPEDVLGTNGAIARRGAEELGWSGGPIRRNIRSCHGHGVCAFGCPIDAKQAMHVTYLPRAVEAGARIVARAKVDRIIMEGARAAGVLAELRDPDTDRPSARLRIRARATVLAAGSVFTPALLMRQRLARSSGQLGRNLVIHPGAGTTALFDDDLSAWRGTMQSFYIDEHLDDGVLLEATFPPPGLGYSAGALPGSGHDDQLLRLYPRVASMGSICSDDGNGRVHATRGGALIRYSLSKRDARRVLEGIARSAELLFAAGARTVYPMLPGLESISSPSQVEEIRSGRWPRSSLHVSAYHPMGTARMGAGPADSVVDPWGAVWGVPDLWVLDASILPSSTHVNPQMTIMAVARRGAARLADMLA